MTTKSIRMLVAATFATSFAFATAHAASFTTGGASTTPARPASDRITTECVEGADDYNPDKCYESIKDK